MKALVTVLTLGVDDLDKAVAFYSALGFHTPGIIGKEFEYGAVAFFDLQDGLRLALWPRASLARDAGVAVGTERSATEFSIGHNVTTKEEVDAVLALARQAGARIVKEAATTFYGGYAGYFADPDGHLWDVVCLTP